MRSFIQIGSICIDMSKYDLKDAHKCEPSTTCDNVSEQQHSLPPIEAQNNQIGGNQSKSDDNVNDVIDLNSDNFIDMANENDNVIDLTSDEAYILISDDGNEDIDPVVQRTDNEIILENNFNNQISSIPSQNSRLFQYPLQFGEGTSKFFQEGTNSRPQLISEEGIEEGSLENFHIPPNNIPENSVPTKENECGDVTHDVDNVLLHEIAEIFINKLPYPVENENGSMGHSILGATSENDGEEVKFEKRSISKSKSKKKRNPKRRK